MQKKSRKPFFFMSTMEKKIVQCKHKAKEKKLMLNDESPRKNKNTNIAKSIFGKLFIFPLLPLRISFCLVWRVSFPKLFIPFPLHFGGFSFFWLSLKKGEEVLWPAAKLHESTLMGYVFNVILPSSLINRTIQCLL